MAPLHLASNRSVCHTQSFADGNNDTIKLRQYFQNPQILSNLVRMGEHIVSKDKCILGQFGDQQGQLRGSAVSIGIEKDTIEWTSQPFYDLSRIATPERVNPP